VTHLSIEVNAACGLIVLNSLTSSSYFVQLDSKAHTADYVLTSCQHSTSTMSSLSSRSATSSESNDSSECMVKGTSAVLQSSQSTKANIVVLLEFTMLLPRGMLIVSQWNVI